MTEGLLNQSDLPGRLVKADGEGMPQGVRGDALHFLDIGAFGLPLHRPPEVRGRYMRALRGRK